MWELWPHELAIVVVPPRGDESRPRVVPRAQAPVVDGSPLLAESIIALKIMVALDGRSLPTESVVALEISPCPEPLSQHRLAASALRRDWTQLR